MAKYIRREFIFPKDFRTYVLEAFITGCPHEFKLQCYMNPDGRIRNYTKKTKLKKVHIVEHLDGWPIGFKIVTLNIDFCKPLSRKNFMREIKLALKTDQFQEEFPLAHQLVQDHGWETKVRKQWKFMV